MRWVMVGGGDETGESLYAKRGGKIRLRGRTMVFKDLENMAFRIRLNFCVHT